MTVRATLWSGTYRNGAGRQIEDGEHWLGGNVFSNGAPIKSARIEPGCYIQFGNADRWSSICWFGGLGGLDIGHAGYIEQAFGQDSLGGKPTRIRAGAFAGPCARLWRNDRYNHAHDPVTPQFHDTASGGGIGQPNWAMGISIDAGMVVKLYRSNHGGPSDPAPLTLGPGDHRLPEGYSGYINALSRVLDDYEVVSEQYDWEHRQVLDSDDTFGATTTATNNSRLQQTISVEVTVEQGCAIEHNWSSSLAAGVSVEVSGGVKPLGIGADVSVTASIEATVGVGGSGSKDTRRSLTLNPEAVVPPRSKMDVTQMMTRERAHVPFIRVLKSKRDGSTVEERSHSLVTMLARGQTIFGAATPLA